MNNEQINNIINNMDYKDIIEHLKLIDEKLKAYNSYSEHNKKIFDIETHINKSIK